MEESKEIVSKYENDYGFKEPGLKMGVNFRENQKMTYFGVRKSQGLENRATYLHQKISKSTPLQESRAPYRCRFTFFLRPIYALDIMNITSFSFLETVRGSFRERLFTLVILSDCYLCMKTTVKDFRPFNLRESAIKGNNGHHVTRPFDTTRKQQW